MNVVSLHSDEIRYGRSAGTMRREFAKANRVRAAYGCAGDEAALLLQDQLSAMSEIAVAKALNLYWQPAITVIGEADVGGFVEVRSITQRGHSLLLHPKDNDESPFVLVLAQPPRFGMLGWIYAGDGKRKEFWKERVAGRPAYFVPESALRPFHELRLETLNTLDRHWSMSA